MRHKAIIINTKEKRIYEEYIKGLEELQKAVGGIITIAFYTKRMRNVCYVNDEGLFEESFDFFAYKDINHQPFAGNGIIIGSNDRGEDIDTSLTVKEVEESVIFISRKEIIKRYGI